MEGTKDMKKDMKKDLKRAEFKELNAYIETPILGQLQQSFPDMECEVKLVDPTFYMTNEEQRAFTKEGPVGWYGCTGDKKSCPHCIAATKPMEKRDKKWAKCHVKLTFNGEEGENLEKIKEIWKNFKDTDKSGGIDVKFIFSSGYVEAGWYGKPGFDDILKAMKVLIPNVTGSELASFGDIYDMNEKLVERLADSETDQINNREKLRGTIIYINENNYQKYGVKIEKIDATLKFLYDDLQDEENYKVISNILSEYFK